MDPTLGDRAEAQGSTEYAQALRAAMVQRVRDRHGVEDGRVLGALGTVPLHMFLLGTADADRAVVTHSELGLATSSASQPAIVAAMVELLGARPGDTVLEVGTGTGYNAALIARLVDPGRVVSVELAPEVAGEASANLTFHDRRAAELSYSNPWATLLERGVPVPSVIS